jgi:hypothetical protein
MLASYEQNALVLKAVCAAQGYVGTLERASWCWIYENPSFLSV